MPQASRRQHLPIGIDFGFDGVKLLQLSAGASGLAVVAAASQTVDGEAGRLPFERLSESVLVIGKLLRRDAFHGRSAVVALPRELITVKNLRLPLIPEAELSAAISFEAETLFSAPADTLELRHIRAGEVRHGSDTKQEVIVLAAVREKIEALVESFHQCGVVVDALEFEPAAAYRGLGRVRRRRDDETEVAVLIDIGWRQTQVTIGRGRDISFYKTIDIGGRQFNEAVARRLGLDAEEARSLRWRFVGKSDAPAADAPRDPVRQAVLESTRQLMSDLAREIGLCLRYHSVTFRGQRATRVRLIGGEASDVHLKQALSDLLPIPVETFNPLDGIDTSRLAALRLTSSAGEWATAFGLSVRSLKGNNLGSAPVPPVGRRAEDVSPVEVVNMNEVFAGAEAGAMHDGMAEVPRG